MEQKDVRMIQQELAQPFAPEDLEWRLQRAFEDKKRGIAVPYVTNRAIQARLDDVVGPDGWTSPGTGLGRRIPSFAASPSISPSGASSPSGMAPRTRTSSRSRAACPTA